MIQRISGHNGGVRVGAIEDGFCTSLPLNFACCPLAEEGDKSKLHKIKGMSNQDAANKRCKDRIVMGGEEKQKSRGKRQ